MNFVSDSKHRLYHLLRAHEFDGIRFDENIPRGAGTIQTLRCCWSIFNGLCHLDCDNHILDARDEGKESYRGGKGWKDGVGRERKSVIWKNV